MDLKRPLYLTFNAIFIFVFVLSCKQDKILPRQEAENCLKIVNSDLINLFDNAIERPEIIALNFVRRQGSSPVPFKSNTDSELFTNEMYNYDNNKGVYNWNEGSQSFTKIRDTSIVFLSFDLPEDEQKHCVLTFQNYEAVKTNSRTQFPTSFNTEIFINGIKEFSIAHRAIVTDELPEKIDFEAKGTGYSLSLFLKREGSAKQDTGNVKSLIELKKGLNSVFRTSINADINYHYPTYSFQYIRFTQTVFNISFEGTIDYANINPTATNYAENFNQHSDITAYSDINKAILGKIFLGPVKNTDQLEAYIRFDDKSEVLLSDYILAWEKLINLKQ